jgi:pimeloyl-ACP methyl ester carboxylesterase
MNKFYLALASTLVGLLLTLIALMVLFTGDAALGTGDPFQLVGPDGTSLSGTYYKGNNSQLGVILLEGFGSDQVAMRSLAVEFHQAGFQLFTFDFAGQGQSSSGQTFDNAQTDRLAREVLTLKANIASITGVSNMQLFMVGHSLGGRVALQTAVIDSSGIKGVVLIGPQVNLEINQQAEFFTGTRDENLEWIMSLSPTTPATDVLILSGELDDILTVNSADALLSRLTGKSTVNQGINYTGTGSVGFSRKWQSFQAIFHNYEIYDPEVIKAALVWTQTAANIPLSTSVTLTNELRPWMWILGMIAIFLCLGGIQNWLRSAMRRMKRDYHGLSIKQIQPFLIRKALLWLAAVPLMLLVAGLAWLIPLNKPVFNLYYLAFIGGYGLLMLLLYCFGRVPFIPQKIKFSLPDAHVSIKRLGLAVIFNVILFFILAYYGNSGWYQIPPSGERLLWVAIFTPFTALGFWIGQMEDDLIGHAVPNEKSKRTILTLIGLLPFFLYAILLTILGSISGLIGGLQGLVILAIVHRQGKITYHLTGIRWLAAVLQAVMLYLLVMPGGALFK